jgi:hypothetical protein
MKIAGQVAEADAFPFPRGPVLEHGVPRRPDRRDPALGAAQLMGCGRRRREQVKRRHANASPHHVEQLFLILFVPLPVAGLGTMIHQLAERIRVVRPKTQGVSVGRDCVGQIAELAPGISEIVKGFREIRPVRERLFEHDPRFVRPVFRQ